MLEEGMKTWKLGRGEVRLAAGSGMVGCSACQASCDCGSVDRTRFSSPRHHPAWAAWFQKIREGLLALSLKIAES